MTSPRPRYIREPRIAQTVEALAAYLDHSVSWLQPRLERWENRLGFPRRDPELDGWDLKAVDLWIDERSNLLSPSDRVAADRRALEGEFGIGQGPRAVSRNQAA